MTTLSAKLLALSLTAFTASGCGLSMFAGQKTPVIEDKVGDWPHHQVGTLAVTTDRRVVLVRLQDYSSGGAGSFCAEPPPDAGQNITTALATMLDVSSEKIDATMKAELAKSFASNFQAFTKRSQGLQLYRDAMYNLCQNYLNHGIEKAEVQKISEEILKTSVKLIESELTLTNGNINEPRRQPEPVAPPLGKSGTTPSTSDTQATPEGNK